MTVRSITKDYKLSQFLKNYSNEFFKPTFFLVLAFQTIHAYLLNLDTKD